MRIAVYARALTSRPTGRGTVAGETLAALRRLVPSAEILVFSLEPPSVDGCAFHPVGGGGFRDAWSLWRGTARELRRFRPDVLWSSTHVLPAGLDPDLPVVATVLDVVWRDRPDTMSLRHRWFARFFEGGLPRARRIACISDFTRERVAAHWPSLAPRLETLHLAPNPRLARREDAPARVRERFGLTGPFVLGVGTFEPRKNFDVLLTAIERLPDFQFVHAGPAGWKSRQTLERARRLRNVRLLGYCEESDLADLYAAAAVGVFPSLYEGFDLPPLDAAALGCPVLASDIPVHREVLGDGAEYFPVDAPDRLAESIRQTGGSDARRTALAEAGRARSREFSWERTAQTLLRIFDGIAGSSGR